MSRGGMFFLRYSRFTSFVRRSVGCTPPGHSYTGLSTPFSGSLHPTFRETECVERALEAFLIPAQWRERNLFGTRLYTLRNELSGKPWVPAILIEEVLVQESDQGAP